MSWRRRFRKLHLWIGLSCSSLFLVIAASGAIIAFGHEIDRWLNPQLDPAASSNDIGSNRAYLSACAAMPNERVAMLWSSQSRHGVYAAVLAGEKKTTVYIAPGSGDVVVVRNASEGLIGWATRLHVTLLAGPAGNSSSAPAAFSSC